MPIPPLPPLPTLDIKPTWVNRAGRVDRSACVELRAADLWRLATFHTICKRSASPDPYLEARATITISARWLHQLHINRNPLALQGDWRTSKANGMKSRGKAVGIRQLAIGGGADSNIATPQDPHPSPLPEGEGTARHLLPNTQHLTPVSGGSYDERYPYDARAQWEAYIKHDGTFLRDHPLPAINPNRGAPFSTGGKQIGLTHDWKQELVIERWHLHERLSKHYLRCPNSHKERGISHEPLAMRHEGGKESHQAIPSSPHGSWLMAHGSQSPSSPHASSLMAHGCPIPSSPHASSLMAHGCQGKALKLFTPVCSIQEGNDAGLAEGWILLTDARYGAMGIPMPGEVMELRGKLLERYGVLFQGRRLVCRKCLGVRYGEVRKRKASTDDADLDQADG